MKEVCDHPIMAAIADEPNMFYCMQCLERKLIELDEFVVMKQSIKQRIINWFYRVLWKRKDQPCER